MGVSEKELNKIMKGLKLKEIKVYKKNLGAGYSVALGEIAGKKLVLKIVEKSNNESVLNLRKEIRAGRLITSYNRDNPNAQIRVVDAVKSGESVNCYWLLRKYCPGEALWGGKDDQKEILWGHDILNANFLADREKIIGGIVDNLNLFQKIGKKNDSEKKIMSGFKKRFDNEIKDSVIKKAQDVIGFNLKRQHDFYLSNRKDYLSDENICACVGDLVPANIIVDKNSEDKNNIFFSDLAYFCMDNYMVDRAYFWLFLWRYPKWQDYFLKLVIATEKDKKHFRLSLIREMLSLDWHERLIGVDHIWLRYLKAAGESFKALMRVK